MSQEPINSYTHNLLNSLLKLQGVLCYRFDFFLRKQVFERCHHVFAVGDDGDAFFDGEDGKSEVFGAVELHIAIQSVTLHAVHFENGFAVNGFFLSGLDSVGGWLFDIAARPNRGE